MRRRTLSVVCVLCILATQTPASLAASPSDTSAPPRHVFSGLLGRRTLARLQRRLTLSGERASSTVTTAVSSARARRRSHVLSVRPQQPRIPRQTSSSSNSSAPSLSSVSSPSIPPFVAPAVSPIITRIREDILRLINEEREREGLVSLSESARLDASAQFFAQDMATRDFFSHTDPDGGTSADRIRAVGYLIPPCDCSWSYWTGENIARHQKTAEQVMREWMASPGHRANILSGHFTEVGIGWYQNHWVQHFGKVEVRDQ